MQKLRDAADRFELDRKGSYAVLGLRLMMGWVFLHSGLSKLAENGLAYGYASKYLSGATPAASPHIAFSFPEILGIPGAAVVKAGAAVAAPLFELLASLPFIGTLVVITEISIGLALILGGFTRLASYVGAFMMFLFYYGNAAWKHGLLNGDAVYLFVLLALACLGAGRIFGLDETLRENDFTEKHPWLKYLLS
ncbi:MAG: DoxX family protein [Candidatus Nanohaloarchaea archaeon]